MLGPAWGLATRSCPPGAHQLLRWPERCAPRSSPSSPVRKSAVVTIKRGHLPLTNLKVLVGALGMAAGWHLAGPVVGLLSTVAILGVLRSALRQVGDLLMDTVDSNLAGGQGAR